MRVPSAEELAAIVVAYRAVLAREAPPAPREHSRWRLAGRFTDLDAASARIVARAGSRWNAAGRLGG